MKRRNTSQDLISSISEAFKRKKARRDALSKDSGELFAEIFSPVLDPNKINFNFISFH